MIKDLTNGNPLKLITGFAMPILLGNIFQQLFHISDILIVGRLLGVKALAALGASAPVFFMFLIVRGFFYLLILFLFLIFLLTDDVSINTATTARSPIIT